MPPNTIPCPGCGRPYPDDGRFAGGRTLSCTCGARVGRRVESTRTAGEEPRFMVDSMLGGLARWLRVLGYDAAWEPEIPDPELVRRGVEERRIVLTRDRRLAEEWWLEDLLLLREEDPLAQLSQVAEAMGLSTGRAFTRCTVCNTPVLPTDPGEVADRLPLAVRERGTPVARCPGCDRVYWEGSHTARMRRELARALERHPGPP